MRCKRKTSCRGDQRGSALLIVFLFAAFVAIMLYEEMPVMAFEAQRAKEQLLIDRGDQYKQAVKVYWTHFQGRFPPDINALENTNNIRFLRRRYKDPFTGKDDWRLLHMAPGGMGLIDSKVNPMPSNANQNGQSGQSSSFGNGNATGGFGASAFGSQPAANNNSSISGPVGSYPGNNGATAGMTNGGGPNGPVPNNVGGPPVYSVPQRPPALAATGSPIDPNADPNEPNSVNGANNPNNGNAGSTQTSGMAAFVNTQPNQNGMPMPAPGQPRNQASPNQPSNAVQQIYGMLSNQGPPAQSQAPGGAFNQPGSANTAGASAFGTTTGTSAFGSNNGTNTTLGGMFAGVASIAQGTGIKIIQDQHDYSKWEFWFNPQEANTIGGINGAQSPVSPVQNGPSNQQNGFGFGTGSSQQSTQGSTPGSNSSSFSNSPTSAVPSNPQPQQ